MYIHIVGHANRVEAHGSVMFMVMMAAVLGLLLAKIEEFWIGVNP